MERTLQRAIGTLVTLTVISPLTAARGQGGNKPWTQDPERAKPSGRSSKKKTGENNSDTLDPVRNLRVNGERGVSLLYIKRITTHNRRKEEGTKLNLDIYVFKYCCNYN